MIDIFSPLNNLEKCLMAVAQEGAAKQLVYPELFSSSIYLLGDLKEPPPAEGAGDTLRLSLKLMTYSGQDMLPIFSSLGRLREFTEDQDYAEMSFSQLLKVLMQAEALSMQLIINPGSPYRQIFTVQEMQIAWKKLTPVSKLTSAEIIRQAVEQNFAGEGLRKVQFNAQTSLVLAPPKNYAPEIIARLKGYLGEKPQVLQAYMATIYIPSSSEPPHTVLGIELREGGSEDELIFREILLLLQELLQATELLEVIKMNEDCPITHYMQRELQPFYRKPWAH